MKGGKIFSPKHCLPQKIFVVLISLSRRLDPMVKMGPEGLSQSKIPGIEPATFPLEGHYLNQLHHINQYYV
jgi:hypothetical protein